MRKQVQVSQLIAGRGNMPQDQMVSSPEPDTSGGAGLPQTERQSHSKSGCEDWAKCEHCDQLFGTYHPHSSLLQGS